ncbi:MAG: hypothetical protein IJ075_04150 [Lachnospiraceae bacterium]|nr:hypothetical protein [Lachnospiraceae bacterium]MBQ9605804.1 hypothetical protein [Lachnospiraceae bacterium]MBR1524376.1 hypothetical protein [Lachnospiraceae bacterium]
MDDEKKIAYQNKDIASKIISEEFKGKTFDVYGFRLGRIKDIKPTNLPSIEANELRLDNLFEFEDGSYAIVDYESEYRERNKCDYLKYFARLNERLYNELGHFATVRLLIIYTADVDKSSTEHTLDIGGVKMEIEEAFLTDNDPGALWDDLVYKIDRKYKLSDEDVMRLIIYPLTCKGNKAKQEAVGRAVNLAKRIPDERRMVFILKMMWVFADKFITKNDADRIKEELMMTKVDMLYEEEKREAVNKAVEETTKEVTERVTTEVTATVTASVTATVTEEVASTIAKNLIRNGSSIEDVVKNTGLTRDKVVVLKKDIEKEKLL